MERGDRYNEGKLRYDLIPPEVEEEYAKVLTAGCKKYDDRNWEKGLSYMDTYACLRRHLAAWVDTSKSDIDKESGLKHLSHALWNVAALITFTRRGRTDCDDRIYPSNKFNIDKTLVPGKKCLIDKNTGRIVKEVK